MSKNTDLARECGATTRQLMGERHKRIEFTTAQLDAFAERIRAEVDADLVEQKNLYALLHTRVREQDLLIAQMQGGAPEAPADKPERQPLSIDQIEQICIDSYLDGSKAEVRMLDRYAAVARAVERHHGING